MLFRILLIFGFLGCVHCCGSSPVIASDPHLFDNLFFNVTDSNNETETFEPEATTLASTTTSMTTTTPLPLLLSLPKIFRDFGRSKWMPFGKHSDYVSRLLINPTWRFSCSPPVSWTYCWPHCGSGDQALDSDNAVENAQGDVAAAVMAALQVLKVGIIPEDQVKVRFTPKNALLEEFGDYFDRNQVRYRVVRNSVRYSYTKNSPGKFMENIDEITITIRSSMAFTENLWKSIANEIASYLTKEKYLFIKTPLKLVSYSKSEQAMFFF